MKIRKFAAVLPEQARSRTISSSQIPSIFDGDFSWIVELVVTNPKLARKIRKQLQRAERRRRRDTPWQGRRLDPHGRHRTLVVVSISFQLGDWRHEPMWDTIR